MSQMSLNKHIFSKINDEFSKYSVTLNTYPIQINFLILQPATSYPEITVPWFNLVFGLDFPKKYQTKNTTK